MPLEAKTEITIARRTLCFSLKQGGNLTSWKPSNNNMLITFRTKKLGENWFYQLMSNSDRYLWRRLKVSKKLPCCKCFGCNLRLSLCFDPHLTQLQLTQHTPFHIQLRWIRVSDNKRTTFKSDNRYIWAR